ncbi:transposase [Polymorphospora sp. A560]|uniref:transposase n=1 Tax=Polymorphospora sp. A560 TaxID=3040203 RepID=UPI003892C52F
MSPLRRPSKYTEEFRRDAADLIHSSGRPINQVARELGMSHETLRNWVRAVEREAGGGAGDRRERVVGGGQGRRGRPTAA